MKPLRAKFIKDIAIRGLVRRTQQAYTAFVVDLTRIFKQPPDTLSYDQVTDWILHLIKERYVLFKDLRSEASPDSNPGLSEAMPWVKILENRSVDIPVPLLFLF